MLALALVLVVVVCVLIGFVSWNGGDINALFKLPFVTLSVEARTRRKRSRSQPGS